MMNPFGGLGDLMKLQKQAKQMQEALKQEQVEVERDGVKIIARGDQHILEVEIDGVSEGRVADAINEAVKKTQELAARKLMDISRNQQ